MQTFGKSGKLKRKAEVMLSYTILESGVMSSILRLKL